MGAELVLALDIGTSSARSALFTTRGRRVASTDAQIFHSPFYTADGGAELSPHELRAAVTACLHKTLGAFQRDCARSSILAVDSSCFWHSLLGVDAKNRPLTPIYTWADSRCREDAAKLRELFSERKIHARTGCMLRFSYWPAKLAWLRRTNSKLFSRVAAWMSPGEWLQRELCGAASSSFSMASGTGLLNVHSLEWDDELLGYCRMHVKKLNPLSDAALPGGQDFFPKLKCVPWFPAIGDGAASNLGSGAAQPGTAAINVGTSAAIRTVKSGTRVRVPFGLFHYRVNERDSLVGGAISNAGNLRGWCMKQLRLDFTLAEIEEELARRGQPRHHLMVAPFWIDERAPSWEENAAGSIHGITQQTNALDILQAATEASFYRLARVAELLLATEKKPVQLIVSGGILQSRASVQRLANILNEPLFPSNDPEASLRGAAIYALRKLGIFVDEPVPKHPIRPQPKIAEVYAAERERYAHWIGLMSVT